MLQIIQRILKLKRLVNKKTEPTFNNVNIANLFPTPLNAKMIKGMLIKRYKDERTILSFFESSLVTLKIRSLMTWAAPDDPPETIAGPASDAPVNDGSKNVTIPKTKINALNKVATTEKP